MGRKKNSFSKAINHLKSKNIDEKLEMLNEIPTNNTSSIYSVVPNSVTVGTDTTQTVPDYSTVDFEVNGSTGRDTTGLFDESGNSKLIAPPGDNTYILGPMSAMYYTWSTPWTKIGYIRESDRRMVNLGTIYSSLNRGGDFNGKLSGWDGSEFDQSGFQIFFSNGQLTLEQAQWFLNTAKKDNAGNDPANANYRAFYPGPPSNAADEFGRYLCTLTGTPKGTKEEIKTTKKAPMDKQGSDNFAALLYKMKKGFRNFGDYFDKSVEDGIQKLVDGLGDKFNEVMDGVIENLGKITKLESAANMLNMYDDYLKNNPNGSDERIDATNKFSDSDLNALSDVRNDSSVNDAINKAIEVNNNPERANKVTNTGQTVGDILWELAADKVRDKLQDKVYSKTGLDNSIHNNVQIDFEEFKNSGGKNWTIIKNYEFRSGGSVEEAENTALGAALTNAGVELDTLGAGNTAVALGALIAAKTGITGANQHGGLYNSPTLKYKVKVPKDKIKINQGGQGGKSLGSTTKRGGVQESISESRKTNIMKTLKDPVVIRETKQKSYKVRPGKRSNYHQGMDKLIGDVKPQKSFKKPANMWSQGWQEYNARSSQDKKNIVLEKIGESKHAWKYMLEHGTMMDAKNLEEFWGKNPDLYSYFFNGKKYKTVRKEQVKGDYIVFLVDEFGAKSSMLQSELNIKLIEEEEEKMLAEYNKLNNIESIPYEKDPLFKKVSKRLKKEIDYPEKPARKGYPNEPPPKLGPDGFHPDFGKKYKYDKLDPISATTMSNAPTGNPEIDANVKKASLKSKVKEGYSDWRSEIEKNKA